MEFFVDSKCLTASSGSYQVKYECTVEVEPGIGGVEVTVESTVPADACPDLLRDTIEHIRLAAEEVLRSKELRGVLQLRNLLIHDVDCWPPRYAKATTEELTKCLDNAANQD